MRTKTTERILSETPQETKDKVRETANEMVGINPQTFEITLPTDFNDYIIGIDPYDEKNESKGVLYKIYIDGRVKYIK